VSGDRGSQSYIRCVRKNQLFTISTAASKPKSCVNEDLQLLTLVNGGKPQYTYSWASSSGQIPASTDKPIVSPLTNTTYTVTVTDAENNTATSSVVVNVLNCENTIYTAQALALLEQATAITASDLDSCIVNYTISVDSAKIINLTVLNTNTALAEWAFWQQGVMKTFTNEVAFENPGWNIIYQTITCNSKKKSTNSVTFVDAVNIVTTGIEEKTGKSFKIYPNPVKNMLYVVASTPLSHQSNRLLSVVEVTNTLGQTVYNSPLTNHNSPLTINVSQLQPGIYFIRLGNEVHKFVKE